MSENQSPQTDQAVTFCYIFKRNIGQKQCRQECSVVTKNQRFCTPQSCPSPWRICLWCAKQGYTELDALVVDPKSGLCELHKKKGVDAKHTKRPPALTVTDGTEPFENAVEPTHVAEDIRETVVQEDEIMDLPIDRIRPDPYQPRKYFDPEKLRRLALSIQKVKQQEPIKVERVSDGDPNHDWQIIGGERRWRAMKLIPCTTIRGYEVGVQNDLHRFILSATANIGGEELSVPEEVHTCQRLKEEAGLSVVEIAAMFTLTEASIYQRLALLKLHPDIFNLLHPSLSDNERLTPTMGYVLTPLPHEKQLVAIKLITKKKLNLNQARHLVRKLLGNTMWSTGGRRTPRDDFRIFNGFIKRTMEQMKIYTDFSPTAFAAMFKTRMPEELREIHRSIGFIQQRLAEISDSIPGRRTPSVAFENDSDLPGLSEET